MSPLNPNQPFPEEAFTGGEIPVSSIKAKADGEFTLGNDGQNVKFSADGGGFAALGVYRDPEKLVNALNREGLSAPMADLMHLKIADGEDGENLLALRWGYGFKAAIEGKVALAAIPGLNFGFSASGQTTGLCVLLHLQKRTDTITDSLRGTLQSWRLPRQVKSIENLNPGTTVLYETMGSVGITVGAEYGYNFSWTREAVKIGALSADLNLKIEAANNGQVAVICAKHKISTESGHSVMVVPETSLQKAERSGGVVVKPVQSQAGRNNHRYQTNTWWISRAADFREHGFWINAL